MDDIEDKIEDDDGGSTTASFSVPQWLIFKKRLLLRKRELCKAINRKTEMRQKIMIQDTLRVSSKQKIQPLENRRLFLPWQSDYSKLNKQFQSMNLQDWRTELLKLAKQSLRMKVDVESCDSMTSLAEFEGFIRASYISGMNLLIQSRGTEFSVIH